MPLIFIYGVIYFLLAAFIAIIREAEAARQEAEATRQGAEEARKEAEEAREESQKQQTDLQTAHRQLHILYGASRGAGRAGGAKPAGPKFA